MKRYAVFTARFVLVPMISGPLRCQKQGALNVAGQSQSLEQLGWIHVVITRFIDNADEVVRFRVGVSHYRI
jgi:hypothetical protein